MVDSNHSLWLSASHLPALRLPMILTKTSTKTDKSSFSQKRLISLSPHLIFRTTPFYLVTYSPFCNLIGLQYALQREQLALDRTLSARARGCGYARLGLNQPGRPGLLYPLKIQFYALTFASYIQRKLNLRVTSRIRRTRPPHYVIT